MTNREQELLLAEAVKADEPAAIFALMDHIQEFRDKTPDGERQRNLCAGCKYYSYTYTYGGGNAQWCAQPILAPIAINYVTGAETQVKAKCEKHNKDGLCRYFISRIKKRAKKKR